MSEKSCLLPYSNSLYKNGQDALDILYVSIRLSFLPNHREQYWVGCLCYGSKCAHTHECRMTASSRRVAGEPRQIALTSRARKTQSSSSHVRQNYAECALKKGGNALFVQTSRALEVIRDNVIRCASGKNTQVNTQVSEAILFLLDPVTYRWGAE